MEAHCDKHIASERQCSSPSQVSINRKNSYNRKSVTIEYSPVLQRARRANENFNARGAHVLSREKVKNLVQGNSNKFRHVFDKLNI